MGPGDAVAIDVPVAAGVVVGVTDPGLGVALGEGVAVSGAGVDDAGGGVPVGGVDVPGEDVADDCGDGVAAVLVGVGLGAGVGVLVGSGVGVAVGGGGWMAAAISRA